MSVIIRLSKTGKKGESKYRIVVKERRSKRDGKFIELLGQFEKREAGNTNTINMERYKYWISVGAKPTPTVASLIK